LPDIAEVDQNIFNSIDIDTSDVFDSCIHSQLRNCNMTLLRSSKDGTANRLGRLLTDFCRRNEMAILNGRCFLDTEGNLTCNDISVIDYVVSTCEAIPMFNTFNISEFCPLLSDVHCCLNFSLNANINNTIDVDVDEKVRKFNWDKKNDYLENLNVQKLNEAIFKLSNDDLTQTMLNDVVTSIETLLVDNAKTCFGVYSCKPNISKYHNKKHKQWFNNDCKDARNKFHMHKQNINMLRLMKQKRIY